AWPCSPVAARGCVTRCTSTTVRWTATSRPSPTAYPCGWTECRPPTFEGAVSIGWRRCSSPASPSTTRTSTVRAPAETRSTRHRVPQHLCQSFVRRAPSSARRFASALFRIPTGESAMNVTASVVGSYPKPPHEGQPFRLRSAIAARERGEISGADLARVQDDLVEELIGEQVGAGVDLVTDGHARWPDAQTPLAE